MAFIDILPLSVDGVRPPLNLLYELFSGKLDTKNLMYPLDLGTNPTYGHAIQFSIYDYEYPIADTVGNAIGNIASGIQENDAAGFINNFTNNINLNNILGGLGSLAPINLRPRKTKSLSNISLYMPDTLAFDYNHNYGEIELTQTLGGYGILASAIADSGAYLQGKDNSKGNFANLIAKPGALYLADKLIGGDQASVLGNVMKQVPNPQLQLLYKGIGLRQFQFEFRFTPNSAKEAQAVDEIIKTFTYYSVPRLLGAQSHQYLEPPQIFNIKFAFTGGNDVFSAVNNFFKNIGTNILTSQIAGGLFGSNPLDSASTPKAKIFEIYSDCILENMNIDYAPNGWAAHDDGYPVEIRLTLQFKEMDIVTKDNVDPQRSAESFVGSQINDIASEAWKNALNKVPTIGL